MNRPPHISQGYSEKKTPEYTQKISKSGNPLSKDLTSEDIYLPDGKAAIIASELFKTSSNQVRKFYGMIKEAEHFAENGEFAKGKDKLYMIVPLAAYAFGRDLMDDNFYEFIKACIKKEKILSNDDIYTFSHFFESIVAYSKMKENKR